MRPRQADWKLDHDCDKPLLRLASYIASTLKLRLKGWIGGKPENVKQHY